MLSDDAPALCDDGDSGCNCSDDGGYNRVCNAYDHGNDHVHGALPVSVNGVHHDVEASVVRAAD